MRRIENMIGRCEPDALTVQDLMEDSLVTCSPEDTVECVTLMLCDKKFGSLPVVNDQQRLVGIITEFDLLKVMLTGSDLRALTVKEIMIPDVITVTEDVPVSDLITCLQTHHLIRVPVVKDKTLVGIVSRRDVLYGYVKAVTCYLG